MPKTPPNATKDAAAGKPQPSPRNAPERAPARTAADVGVEGYPAAKPPNLERLLRHLTFNTEAVVDAACEQALLFEEAARYRVDRMRDRQRTEMALEETSARTELAIRHEASAMGDKLTESGIKSRVTISEAVLAAQKAFNDAEALEEYSKLLLRCYSMREKATEILDNSLSRAERAVQSLDGQAKLQRERQRLEEKYPGRQL